MLDNRTYLQAKFDTLSLDIEKDKQKGINFSICPACGYESEKEEVIDESLSSTECLICEMQLQKIKVTPITLELDVNSV